VAKPLQDAIESYENSGGFDCSFPEEAVEPLMVIAAAFFEYREAVEQMLAYEQAGGDGWWKGWDRLKSIQAKGKACEYCGGNGSIKVDFEHPQWVPCEACR
jgi:hypothetical protein